MQRWADPYDPSRLCHEVSRHGNALSGDADQMPGNADSMK
jgi:hypothetical protein